MPHDLVVESNLEINRATFRIADEFRQLRQIVSVCFRSFVDSAHTERVMEWQGL